MNMHFDKDESTYWAEDVLRVHEVSTVTYLSGAGSPTLVLDQSMGSGADAMDPPRPIRPCYGIPSATPSSPSAATSTMASSAT